MTRIEQQNNEKLNQERNSSTPRYSKKRQQKIDKIKNDQSLSEAQKEVLISQLEEDC